MKRTPRISEAEWEVMKVLWEHSPRTANDIVKELTSRTPWKRETIRTLINRLVKKDVVGFEKKGKQYHYVPLFDEAECVKTEMESFVKRFGAGAIEPMLAAFVEEKKLSAEKIAKLKAILDKSGTENQEDQ